MTTLVEEAVERVTELANFMKRNKIRILSAGEGHRIAEADLRTLLAALPTDDDVERVARAICKAAGDHPSCYENEAEMVSFYGPQASAAIHTLIGRAG